MAARRSSVHSVECLAQRALAYANDAAQGGNVERLVYTCESHSHGSLDKPARSSSPPGGCLHCGCDPTIIVHREHLSVVSVNCTPDNTRKRSGDIVLWGNRRPCGFPLPASERLKCRSSLALSCRPRRAETAIPVVPPWRPLLRTTERSACAIPYGGGPLSFARMCQAGRQFACSACL
jgi:hypothetical protein